MGTDDLRSTSRRIVKAACPHDCPDTCAMDVTVENGVAVDIKGGDMPFTDGVLCTKVAKYLDRTYSKDRVLHPMRRVGAKGPGKGRFERITWDEALDEIAARFKAIAAEDPQQILPCSYAGTMGLLQYASMDRRFFYRLGASLLDRTLCSSAGKAGIKLTLGGSVGMDPERFDEARLILIWGSNPIVSNLHLWTRCQEAKRRGAKLVAIDPWRSQTAEKCHQHVALLPGTDGALALGLMHVIIGEGLHDRDYVAQHTLGFDELAERVQGLSAREGRADLRHHRRRGGDSRARVRHGEAGGDPAQLRHAAPLGRRHGGAHRSPACRRSSARGAMRPAASCSRPPTSTAWITRRSSVPTDLGTRRARSTSRSSATRWSAPTRRSRRSTSTTTTRSRSAPTRTR